MLDKIVLSQDRKTATVILSDKTFTIYSDVDVIALTHEILFADQERRERAEEVTEVIEIQLSFDIAS